jgi:hypothetical protein
MTFNKFDEITFFCIFASIILIITFILIDRQPIETSHTTSLNLTGLRVFIEGENRYGTITQWSGTGINTIIRVVPDESPIFITEIPRK